MGPFSWIALPCTESRTHDRHISHPGRRETGGGGRGVGARSRDRQTSRTRTRTHEQTNTQSACLCLSLSLSHAHTRTPQAHTHKHAHARERASRRACRLTVVRLGGLPVLSHGGNQPRLGALLPPSPSHAAALALPKPRASLPRKFPFGVSFRVYEEANSISSKLHFKHVEAPYLGRG